MTKIRLAISGASGRMGASILRAASASEHVVISHALVRDNDSKMAKPVAEFVAEIAAISDYKDLQYSNFTSLQATSFDVLIDFTSIETSLAYAKYCANHNKKILIGTTGFSQEEIAQLQIEAKNASILLSANTSLGVNVVLNLLRKTAAAIGEKSDIEIIEAHHRNKVDSPSGTAVKMGEVIADELNRDLAKDGVFSRHGIIGKRSDTEIGFSTIRAGDIIGDHTVLFTMPGERIEITHKATSRSLFANGAINCASWLNKQDNGWFTMEDLLNLD